MSRGGMGVAVGLAAALAAGLHYLGLIDVGMVLAILAVVAVVTWVGAEVVVRARRRGQAGPLSRQLALVIALVNGPLLVALLAIVLLMFVSQQDAAMVGVGVVFAAALGAFAARRLSKVIVADVMEVRDGLVAVGEGRRELRLRVSGRDELGELATAANAMIERLDAEEQARADSESARRQLVAAVSHDLRTPITSLRLLAASLEDGMVEGEEHQEYLRRMRVHVDALAGLIDDLFELARLEAGEIAWSMQQVGLAELVAETVDAMRPDAQANGVALSAHLPDALRAVRANPEKLQRVLFNLIQNAIRHTPADGSVVVRAEALAEAVEVEVTDTGAGISEADRPLIFDAFYRGEMDSERSTAGAGLGLAIARAIVEAHGGRIWLADGAGRGTRVRFSVPTAA